MKMTVVSILVLLPSCSGYYVQQNRFKQQEYSTFEIPGHCVIYGTVYLSTYEGEKALGRNCDVYLNPLTSVSKEWLDAFIINGNRVRSNCTEVTNIKFPFNEYECEPYLRKTRADEYGRFEFSDLPAGEYCLT